MAVSPNDGLRVSTKKIRFIMIRSTPRPLITNSSIAKEKCQIIVNSPPEINALLDDSSKDRYKVVAARFIKGPLCVLLDENQNSRKLAASFLDVLQ